MRSTQWRSGTTLARKEFLHGLALLRWSLAHYCFTCCFHKINYCDFHIQVRTWRPCLPELDLFASKYFFSISSIWPQVTTFYYFYGLMTFHCIYISHFLCSSISGNHSWFHFLMAFFSEVMDKDNHQIENHQ